MDAVTQLAPTVGVVAACDCLGVARASFYRQRPVLGPPAAPAPEPGGADRRRSPPLEGPASLQGLLMCGRCGKRMTVRYESRHGRLVPDYLCQREGIEHSEPMCQRIPAAGNDERVGDLLIEALTPVTIDVALAVQ